MYIDIYIYIYIYVYCILMMYIRMYVCIFWYTDLARCVRLTLAQLTPQGLQPLQGLPYVHDLLMYNQQPLQVGFVTVCINGRWHTQGKNDH